MPRQYDDSQQQNSAKTRRQQEDQRRMAFRRAIESRFEDRRLTLEYDDYLDAGSAHFWQSASASEGARQNARPAR